MCLDDGKHQGTIYSHDVSDYITFKTQEVEEEGREDEENHGDTRENSNTEDKRITMKIDVEKEDERMLEKESEEDIQDNTNAEDQKRKSEVHEDELNKHSEEQNIKIQYC